MHATSAAGGIVGTIVGGTVGAFFDALGKWVADGAVWVLGQVGHVMTATTTIDLGASWFTSHERVMAVLAATLAVPMLCCTAMLAVYRQDASLLVRTAVVHLPLALLLTGVAVELVRLGLAATDQLSDTVLAAGGVDTDHMLTPIAAALVAAAPATAGAAPAFVLFVGSVLVTVAALTLWLELVVRSAAVAAATLFLPLALIGLVWPAVSHWARRLTDTLVALVLSKLVIAAVLSLAASALNGGGSALSSGDVAGGFAVVMTGIALLFVAVTAPFVLLRLVPAVEAGAILHLEATRRHLSDAAFSTVERAGVALSMAQGGGMVPGASDGFGAGAGGPSPSPVEQAEGEDPADSAAWTGLAFEDPRPAPTGADGAAADARTG